MAHFFTLPIIRRRRFFIVWLSRIRISISLHLRSFFYSVFMYYSHHIRSCFFHFDQILRMFVFFSLHCLCVRKRAIYAIYSPIQNGFKTWTCHVYYWIWERPKVLMRFSVKQSTFLRVSRSLNVWCFSIVNHIFRAKMKTFDCFVQNIVEFIRMYYMTFGIPSNGFNVMEIMKSGGLYRLNHSVTVVKILKMFKTKQL